MLAMTRSIAPRRRVRAERPRAGLAPAGRSGSRGRRPCARTYFGDLPDVVLAAGRRRRRAARRRGSRDGSSAASTIASTPRRRASSTIAWPARRARTVAVATSTPSYSSPTAFARAQRRLRALELRLGQARVDRQRHRHLEDPDRLDRRAVLAGSSRSSPASRPAVCTMSSSSGLPKIGTRIEPYSARGGSRAQRLLGHRHALEQRRCRRRGGRSTYSASPPTIQARPT